MHNILIIRNVQFLLVYIFFSSNNSILALAKIEIALIVTEVVGLTRFGLIDVGEIAKLKSQIEQLRLGSTRLAMWIERCEYTSVFAQHIGNVTHEVGGVSIVRIVMCDAAAI